MEFAHACKGLGIKAITGAELTLDDGPHLTLLAAGRTGYRNLCRLITSRTKARAPDAARRAASRRRSPSSSSKRHAEGLVCLSGCARDGLLARAGRAGDARGAERIGRRLLRAFGPERFRVELQRPFWRRDRARNRALARARRAARRAMRGDRQRPLPPSRPRPPPGRVRRRAAALDARPDRAAAARQRAAR